MWVDIDGMMKGSEAHLLTSRRVTMATPILCILHYHIAHFRQEIDDFMGKDDRDEEGSVDFRGSNVYEWLVGGNLGKHRWDVTSNIYHPCRFEDWNAATYVAQLVSNW
jgi:hypothetical protein